jgi:archaellum component FlaC
MSDGAVFIDVDLNTKSFEAQIKETEDKLNDMLADYQALANSKGFNEQSNQAKHLRSEIQKVSNQLQTMKKRQEDLEKANISKTFENLPNMIENIQTSTSGLITKVAKWGLALWGIRSIYSFISRSVSTLSQYNDQIGADVEYIRFALASMLQPLVETLIQLAYKLLTYTSMIAKAWFGVDLFARASTKAFLKNEKALGGAVKNAKELKKQLAGFDEMNILQDNGDISTGGGGGGVTLPSFDLSAPNNIKPPEWLTWIINHKDDILGILTGITMALIGIKAGLDPLTSLGIGLIVAGLYESLSGLLDFMQNPTFENFTKILQGIALAIVGVGLAFGLWPVAVAGAVALVVVEIVKHFDEIMGLFDNLINWLDKNFLGALRTLFGPVGDLIYAPIKFALEFAKNTFQSFYGGIKQIVDGIVKIFQGEFTSGISDVFSGLLNIMLAPIFGFFKTLQSMIPNILNAFREIGSKVGEVLGGAFKSVINTVLSWIETQLNKPISSINSLISTINDVPGINLGRLSTIRLPRLAKGTIVNNPGKGVLAPSGNAIYGEAGPEAYLPLSDTRLLEQLGSTIGKYITINANITNSMNGRIISRELQKINAESDFAFNR